MSLLSCLERKGLTVHRLRRLFRLSIHCLQHGVLRLGSVWAYCHRCQVIVSTAMRQSGCWGSPWCFSPFPGLLRWGIKPAVDFTAAWDPRGSVRESASLHWILLLLLWLRKCRKRCLNECRQNNYLKFFASKSSYYLPVLISHLIGKARFLL